LRHRNDGWVLAQGITIFDHQSSSASVHTMNTQLNRQTNSHVNGHQFRTVFASLDDYVKGDLEIINDNPKYYAFSNIFEVASKSKPYEKVVVALNQGYVLEVLRSEGVSPWFAASHDEFVIVMDGAVEVELVKLEEPDAVAPPERQGSVLVGAEPTGRRMGHVKAGRGHQVLLPKGAAYRFCARAPGVMLMQTIQGELSVQKWAEICYK